MHFFRGIVFIVVLGISVVASAAQPISGFYMGGFGGANFHKIKIGGKSLAYKQESYNETGFNAGIQAGVRIMNVRLAAEATFNTKVDFGNYQLEGENYALQLYYDLPFKSAFRPYLNVGYGRYNMTLKAHPGLSQDFKKMALNYGGGFTLTLTRRTNLDIGYRFVNLGTKNLEDSDGFPELPVKLMHHQVYMGFRYVF